MKKLLELIVLWVCLFSIANVVQAESNSESSTSSTVSTEKVSVGVGNLSYDISTKTLSGKTEANAFVFVIGDSGQGRWTADKNGNFSCNLKNSKAGEVLKVSAGFDNNFGNPVTFTIPTDENEISVSDLSYDATTKTLSGKTEANAVVFVIGNSGQGRWTADKNGNFSCDLQNVEAGEILKISAGFNNNFGASVTFTIPTSENEISVSDLSYDATTKTLSGKTEANAVVFVMGDSGQGRWTADKNGNFSCDLQNVEAGEVLKISAGFNNNFGASVTFTIPISQTNQSTQKQDKQSKEDKNTSKAKLPSTGEIGMKLLPFVGIVLIMLLVIAIIIRYQKKKR